MSNAGYGNHDAPPPTAPAQDGRDAPKPGDPKGEASPPAPERRDVSTPGGGALPDGSQGDDVDPGVG